MSEEFLGQALIYLGAAVISVPIAKRFGLGSVLGYLVAGMIIGPFGMNLGGGRDVMHFAEFGVVLMLFLIGLELQPNLLWRMRVPILGLGCSQVLVSAFLISALVFMIGSLPWQSSLVIGMVLALSSTAITLQMLNEKGLLNTDGGQNSFAVLLFQDIAIIPMLALFPLLAIYPVVDTDPQHTTLVEGLPAWEHTLIVLGTVAFIIVAGRFIVGHIFRIIAKTRLREIFTAAALLLVIGITLLMTVVGLSPALGTFLAGVVLANSEYRHELEADIEPFKGILLGLFFISVGASIDFGMISGMPITVTGLVAALIMVKLCALLILGRYFGMALDQNILFSMSLAQGGEFGFVLFAFAESSGVLTPAITDLLVAVVALSMACAPLMMIVNERLIQPRFGSLGNDKRKADDIDRKRDVIIVGFGDFGNIVGRLLKASGVEATLLDLDSDNVDLLRKLGFNVFYGDASRLDLLRAAGAEHAKALVIAIRDPDEIHGLVETCKKNFPHLKILSRASARTDAYDLLDQGVTLVYRDSFDTALRLGTDALCELGFRQHHAYRCAQIFRKHDEEYLRELAKMRHDKTTYLNQSRRRIRDLEEILLEERSVIDEQRDVGWDTDSMIHEARLKAEDKGKA